MSGREGRSFDQCTVNPIPVTRGGGQSHSGGPATSTNRTALGSQSRYHQLTFEETAQQAGAQHPGEEGPAKHLLHQTIEVLVRRYPTGRPHSRLDTPCHSQIPPSMPVPS